MVALAHMLSVDELAMDVSASEYEPSSVLLSIHKDTDTETIVVPVLNGMPPIDEETPGETGLGDEPPPYDVAISEPPSPTMPALSLPQTHPSNTHGLPSKTERP